MKKSVLFALSLGIILSSCGGNSEHSTHKGHDMELSDAAKATGTSVSSNASTAAVIDAYLALKDALVADDQATAAAKGQELTASLVGLDVASSRNPEELGKLRDQVTGISEKLASGDIATQRENFQALSVILKDLLKTAGTDRTLYQQYCPMYKNNTGGMWLSASEEIKNPLFGSSMLTCGRVEETIAVN